MGQTRTYWSSEKLVEKEKKKIELGRRLWNSLIHKEIRCRRVAIFLLEPLKGGGSCSGWCWKEWTGGRRASHHLFHILLEIGRLSASHGPIQWREGRGTFRFGCPLSVFWPLASSSRGSPSSNGRCRRVSQLVGHINGCEDDKLPEHQRRNSDHG